MILRDWRHLYWPNLEARHAQLICLLLLFGSLSRPSNCISIDNDIVGEPDIECLDQEIRVWVKTRKMFAGRIYAKGKAEDPECMRDDFAVKRTKKPQFNLPLGMCGMRSLRSFDPRGMYYGITVVISFHPLFITKIDQAFHVKCFFEEANRGLTAELGVSTLPTKHVEARHGIPGCTYSIHRSSIDELDAGRPPGAPIQFAKVGDKVLHQWHCDDQMYGVLINNCYVTDGVKMRAEVIDSHGCPVDPILITGIRYSSDLQRAYAESQVFKFADRPGVWFFCQITMCMKKEGMCQGITPPGCSTTTGHNITATPLPLTTPEQIGKAKPTAGEGITTTADNNERSPAPSSQTPNQNGQLTGSGIANPDIDTYDANIDGEGRSTLGDSSELPALRSDTKRTRGNGQNSSNNFQRTTGKPPLKQKQHDGNRNPYDVIGNEVEHRDEDANSENKHAAATVFGPPYSPEVVPGGYGPNVAGAEGANPYSQDYQQSTPSQRQETITEFETEDDLESERQGRTRVPPSTTPSLPSTITTTITGPRKGEVPQRVDYDSDVTIPPHLTDLLANLPQEISADSLQKMFRDSVADRRALLQGFDLLVNRARSKGGKVGDDVREGEGVSTSRRSPRPPTLHAIDPHSAIPSVSDTKILRAPETREVPWDSSASQAHRLARDLPMQVTGIDESKHMGSNYTQLSSPVEPPFIAGQLLIYDLDETPPLDLESKQLGGSSVPAAGEEQQFQRCLLSHSSGFLLVVCIALALTTLIALLLCFYIKMPRREPNLDTIGTCIHHQTQEISSPHGPRRRGFTSNKWSDMDRTSVLSLQAPTDRGSGQANRCYDEKSVAYTE